MEEIDERRDTYGALVFHRRRSKVEEIDERRDADSIDGAPIVHQKRSKLEEIDERRDTDNDFIEACYVDNTDGASTAQGRRNPVSPAHRRRITVWASNER